METLSPEGRVTETAPSQAGRGGGSLGPRRSKRFSSDSRADDAGAAAGARSSSA